MTILNNGLSYGYNNIASSTNIINGVAYTQNVINLGNSGACSNTPNYCQEGYSIYTPCIKSITRGQNTCFQLYIADKSNQDTLDLNDMCGLTLDLTGPFGCPYNSYTYPNDIKNLQTEELTEIKCQNFDGNIFKLDLGYIEFNDNTVSEIDNENVNIDENGFNVNVLGIIGDFYEGETPYLRANDSPTHIFVGWTSEERISELCNNFKIDDLIITNEHEWIWDEPINKDITLYAVYRKRKKYKVMVSFDNRHSYFMVDYKNKKYMLSDKERDFVEVMEGYHFTVKCCPLTTKDKDGNIKTTYVFYKWNDGNINQIREYLASDNLFKNNILRLFAKCGEDKISGEFNYNISKDINPIVDFFETCKPEENNIGYAELPFLPNDVINDFDGVKQIYNPDEKNHGYISLSNTGYILFDSNIDCGNLKVIITVDTNNLFEEINKDVFYEPPMIGPGENGNIPEPEIKSVGDIIIKNGDNQQIVSITSKDIKEYIFDFDNCEDGVFEIETTCENLHIDNICVYEKSIINKGLIELCVPSEDTIKFYTGVLNMSGAICVNDNWWGLDSVQVGNVNKNKPIEIKFE